MIDELLFIYGWVNIFLDIVILVINNTSDYMAPDPPCLTINRCPVYLFAIAFEYFYKASGPLRSIIDY